jgi:FtsP/CotA-like multicopper oxidase with cupredoxin domain
MMMSYTRNTPGNRRKSVNSDTLAAPMAFWRCHLPGKRPSRASKDTISMPRYSTAEIDFVAIDPGETLFHCHHQDHMDEGFCGIDHLCKLSRLGPGRLVLLSAENACFDIGSR